ncbi:fatty acyl-AMP ligase [Pelagibius litoralis]|uniref:Fatty acyl-AMP ligase n=1 Tax=Pelagibius litoralis TaxID=374515 RepID=A0A967KC56_9PROT|nr:fatty acyl-AMP ligase [Pelagibius litoralis]NIA71487.1 fatty acyl-AMP ligase [Pelagibius litoralis]
MVNAAESINENLPIVVSDFESLVEGLDYAAKGRTGYNFFSSRGELQQALTYRELRERAVVLAQRFDKAGLQPGARVAIVADTVPDFPIFFFACQYAGLIPVPLPLPIHLGSHEAYVERLRSMITRAGAEVAVGPPEMIHYLTEAAGTLKMIGTPADFYALPHAGGDLRPLAAHEPCYVQYSSGSTSLPRGVFVSQRAITANARGISRHGLKLRSGDRSTSWLPLYHDMGLVGFCLTPMLSQITVDYLSTKSFALRPLTWLKLLSQYGGTISFSPTFGYELCVRRGLNGSAKDLDLERWRIAGIGGDMVRAEILKRFADTFGVTGFSSKAFLPSYGLAESTLAVTFAALDKGAEIDRVNQDHYASNGGVTTVRRDPDGSNRAVRSFVNCGTALPGHAVEVRSEKNDMLPDRYVGRVVVKGPSVMDGYFNDPAATAAVMTDDGWLDTGDLGYMAEGRLIVTGRRKDLVILNGRNIWPQDVEWAVEALEDVRDGDVACFSVIGPDGGEQMVAVLQCRLHDPAARENLRKQAAATVRKTCGADCRIVLVPPKTLRFTSSGKLSRTAVRQDYIAGEIFDVSYPVDQKPLTGSAAAQSGD